MPIPMLKRLKITNFKSIESAAIEFENPTYLVGQNGSGKSNITDAIAMLSELMSSPLEPVFLRRGGVPSVRHFPADTEPPARFGLEVELSGLNSEIPLARYRFDVSAASGEVVHVVREECVITQPNGSQIWFTRASEAGFQCSIDDLKPRLDPRALVLPIIGGDARFEPVSDFLSRMRIYKPDPVALSTPQEPTSDQQLRSDGANVAITLAAIEAGSPSRDAIMNLLGVAVPGMVHVQSKLTGKKVTLNFGQDTGVGLPLALEAHEVSDGTLRLLALLVAIYQPFRASVLVLEEPEATIHPGAMGVLFDALGHAVSRSQVIVTTHSPDVLDQKQIGAPNLRIVEWRKGKTEVGPIPDSAASSLADRIAYAGELLRMNALMSRDVLDNEDIDQYIRETAESTQ